MPIDPVTLAALINTGGSLLQGMMGSKEQKAQVTPSDLFQRQSTSLLPAESQERELGSLQADLWKRLLSAEGGNLPSDLGLGAIAAGRIPAAQGARFDQLAFGGLSEAGRRISAGAGEQALGSGMFGSSFQAAQTAEMMGPLAQQAAQLRAQLQMQELQRLAGLRQTALANMMALQDSPALTRLLQVRLAQPTTSQLQFTRRPGDLPSYAYDTGQRGQGAAARSFYGV